VLQVTKGIVERLAIMVDENLRPAMLWRGKETGMPEAGTFSAVPTKILVPIDFSSSSHNALEAAIELAEKFHAELFLLNVIPEAATVALPESVTDSEIIDAAKKVAETHLATSKKSLDSKGLNAKTSVEVGYDVAGTILEAIEREQADYVVISTHGRSGWYPSVFGSIAEKVVKLAPCPVLLLRTPKPQSSAKVTSSRLMEWW
jgi:nucleotide-binding universal stress UspA family protein